MPNISSIQQEINIHRGDMPEPEWLAANGLLKEQGELYNLVQLGEWDLPGSESYVLNFEVQGNSTVRAIAKACIKSCPVETVQEWQSRRSRLQEYEVAVPKLYSVHRAVYIEEFIDCDFKSAYEKANSAKRVELEENFVWTFGQVLKAGFSPVSLHDVRSRGSDVVLVDLGSDLGGFNRQSQAEYKRDDAENALSKIVG